MSQQSFLRLLIGLGKESFEQHSGRLNRHHGQPVPPRGNDVMMGVADESDHISNASQVPNVVRNDLVQRIGIGCGVADKALVVVDMVSAKSHFRVEREMVSVLLQRLHMVTEHVVGAIRLRQDVREETVAHADAEKPFDIRFG